MARDRPPAGSARVRVSDTGLSLRDVATTTEILFDGIKVWAVGDDAGSPRMGGWREVPWPEGLHRYLDGRTVVTVRSMGTAEIVGTVEHRFGTGAGRVSVTDDRGQAVYMSKWGRANYTFESLDPRARRRWLKTLTRLLEALRDDCAVPAFLSYGTLLGAVRGGDFIGHDVDADVSYVSRFEHPVDVIRESYRIERTLRAGGWRVRRSSGAFLQVLHRDGAGRTRNLDIFTTFFVGDMLYEEFAVGAPLPRSAILPLGRTSLGGWSFPAPADPPAVLAATYGEGWSVPDPGFTFDIPAATRDRLRGWFGGSMSNRPEWSRAYADAPVPVPAGPSALARRLHAEAPPEALVVDLGCGAGTDALWLARAGRTVIGLDYVRPVVRAAGVRASQRGVPATFETLNLYDTRVVLARGAQLARTAGPVVVLARHVLDALDDSGRRNAVLLCRQALAGGGSAYLQVTSGPSGPVRAGATPSRAPGAPGAPAVYPVAAEQVTAELAAHGATVTRAGDDARRAAGSRWRGLGRRDRPESYQLVATWAGRQRD